MALIQVRQKSDSLNTFLNFSSPVTSGSRILVLTDMLNIASSAITGITDGQGNTYTKVVDLIASDSGGSTHNFSAWTTTATATGGLTISIGGSSGIIFFTIMEYGTTTIFTFDQSAGAAYPSGSSPSSGSITTTFANSLLVSYIVPGTTVDPTISAGSGYTKQAQLRDNLFTNKYFAVEDQTVSSTGTFSGNWTLVIANPAAVFLVSFGISSGAPVSSGQVQVIIMQ